MPAAALVAISPWLSGSFKYVSEGCSWYEHHHLGGCIRPAAQSTCTAGQKAPVLHESRHRRTSKRQGQRRQQLAVIIPFRGDLHGGAMAAFCDSLPTHLSRVDADFRLLVVNQVDDHPFNRAALANAGFLSLTDPESLRGSAPTDGQQQRIDCIAVHDVDRFPAVTNRSCEAVTRLYYTCPAPGELPRVLHPESYTGGVLVIRPELFRAVNGFSNRFWGWGHEDNELYLRLRACGNPPHHPARLDWCMVHQDCERCKRAKSIAGTLEALRLETSGIARLKARLSDPLSFAARDGLSTLQFTTVRRHTMPGKCGGHSLHVLDVRLDRASHQSEGQSSCVSDGSEADNGCVAPVGIREISSRVIARARKGLPHGSLFRGVRSASRHRAMYNFHYEIDMDVDLTPSMTPNVVRVAVCDMVWRPATDDGRYQLLFRAIRRGRNGNFKVTKNFSFQGHFPCSLW